MGITICRKHGRAGFSEMCPHVANAVDERSYREFHRFDVFPASVLVCDICLGRFHLGEFRNHPGIVCKEPLEIDDALVEKFIRTYQRIESLTARCAECIAAAQVAQARRDGRPDPFPVYEKTLTSHHRRLVKKLDRHLRRNFNFQRSIVDPEYWEWALFMKPGHYTRPLTVIVYYVIDPAEQDHIVALVSEFLEGRRRNQAKVEFYEAEVWNETGEGGGYRGEEKLLREVSLNC
jgi:hypothetical protein